MLGDISALLPHPRDFKSVKGFEAFLFSLLSLDGVRRTTSALPLPETGYQVLLKPGQISEAGSYSSQNFHYGQLPGSPLMYAPARPQFSPEETSIILPLLKR